jgi:hypothetical protein
VLANVEVAVKYEAVSLPAIYEFPCTDSLVNGVDVPTPRLPKASTMRYVDVAVPAVVVPIASNDTACDDDALYIDSLAYGVDVPIPTNPANVDVAVVDVAIMALTVGVDVAPREPVPVQYVIELEKPEPVSDEPPTHTPLIE